MNSHGSLLGPEPMYYGGAAKLAIESEDARFYARLNKGQVHGHWARVSDEDRPGGDGQATGTSWIWDFWLKR